MRSNIHATGQSIQHGICSDHSQAGLTRLCPLAIKVSCKILGYQKNNERGLHFQPSSLHNHNEGSSHSSLGHVVAKDASGAASAWKRIIEPLVLISREQRARAAYCTALQIDFMLTT